MTANRKHRPSKKYNELLSAFLVKFREHFQNSQHFQNTLTFECVTVSEIKSNKRMPFKEDLRKWNKIMREHVLRTGLNDPYDHKLGRFKPNQCFNVDQTSMLFIINTERAYEEIQKNHEEKV